MAALDLTPLPPAEAVAFFRAKGFRISFAWQDVWQAEHGEAFTVAKAMSEDILADIREAVDSALSEGATFRQFERRLTPVLQDKGWWGRKTLIDPLTGAARRVQLGSPRRLKTIFDVNMRVSHAVGRWQRIERLAERKPFLRYSAVLDSRTRPAHRAWHGTVLPLGHSWWETHYPPNGWRCRCTVIQLSERELERFGFEENARAPRSPLVEHRNRRTGEIIEVPKGIDPGWDYHVGKQGRRID